MELEKNSDLMAEKSKNYLPILWKYDAACCSCFRVSIYEKC